MKALLLTALLFVICPARSQNYPEYYRTVASAQKAATGKAFGEALTHYDSAFTAFEFNNPIDLYVAAQIAGFLDQHERAAGYILKGISFGLPLQTVQENPHLKNAMITRGDLFRQEVDSCMLLYRNRINNDARSRMLALIRFDQAFINKTRGSIYKSGGRNLKEEYVPVWDSLLIELIDITRKWGFPAQKIIGTQNVDDSLFKVSPGNSYAWFVMVHHGKAWPLLKDLLPAELQGGNITPQMYGAIADFCNGPEDFDRMEYFSLRTCEAMVERKGCLRAMRERLPQINAARYRIGLCSYEVFDLMAQSSQAYYSWTKSGAKKKMPAFDFQLSINQW